MSQLIYLSRHGTVRINQEDISIADPGAYDFTEQGVQECRDLGAYLDTLHIPNPFFVDSGLPRTVASVYLAAESMKITLKPGKNYYSAAALGEEVPLEALSRKQREEYYCGRHRNKPIKLALELGVEVHQELVKIGNAFSGNNIIAILHGGINLGLITYLTGKGNHMHNCGLYVLERVEDWLKIVGDYISPEQMRKAMEQAKQIRKGMAVR